MNPLARLALGTALAATVAAAAWRLRQLSAGGALAATAVGGLVFGLGGPAWGALLALFFATSSALTAWRARAKAAATREFAKGGRRDTAQVLANGGLAAALALAQTLRPDWDLFPWCLGALAAAAGDTWATELGLLSRRPPRRITTGRPVPPGTSGGVTALGTAAALAAGALLGLAALPLAGTGTRAPTPAAGPALVAAATIAALAGSLLDSLLGATLQAGYRCPGCGVETERPTHHCGTPATLARGRRGITNDVVNALATAAGAAAAAATLAWLR